MSVNRCFYFGVFGVLLSACNIANHIKPEVVEPVEVEPIGELDFRILHKADYNLDDSVTVKSFRTIRSLADYRSELARYSAEVTAAVDFNAALVLASTMGTQSSGGYIVSVKQVEEFPDAVRVTVELLIPGENCVTTTAISNPYEFVELPTVKPVQIIEKVRVNECD